jgi:hypothetical protein
MQAVAENIFIFFLKRLILVFSFLIISLFALSQDERKDSTNYSETVPATLEDSSAGSNIHEYFKNILNWETDTIQLRRVPLAVIDSLKKDKAFWYADSVLKKQERKSEAKISAPGSQWLDMKTFVIILVLFLGGLIFFLFKSNIIRKRVSEKIVENEQELSENIFNIHYKDEIENAIKSQNFRFAIRLMFLQLLKNLSDKNIIHYKQERTNFDYLSQLYSTNYYDDFFKITRNYEYAWYGKFAVNSETFDIIKNDFGNFYSKLK